MVNNKFDMKSGMYWTASVSISLAVYWRQMCLAITYVAVCHVGSGLSPRSVYVGFAVGEVTLGEISLLVILFSTDSVIPRTLYTFIFHSPITKAVDRVGTVVKVLCYKSEGRWFDPGWCYWNFSLT
jgi:hypothetical protein